jgi:hypothetical protein
MWSQTVAEDMVYTLMKLSREDNPSDMLTHSPAKDDLDKLLPMIGIYPLTVMKRAVEIVKTVLRTYPHMEQQVAAMMIMMMMVRHAEAARPGKQAIVKENGWSIFHEIYFLVVHFWALVGILALLAGIWWWRRPRGITVVRRSLVDSGTLTTPINLTVKHPENIWVTTGDAYHTSASCGHLVHARWSKKRPCLHCTP